MNSVYRVRKWVSTVEEIWHDGGRPAHEPLLKAAVAAVFENPFAGKPFAQDLSLLIDESPWLAVELADRAKKLLGGRPVQSYGKAGIAGVDGEQEHVVACVTSVFGDALRDSVGGGEAWISSVTKIGSAGTQLDIPLAHKDALYVRSHYDAISLKLDDGPKPAELMVGIAVATGGRLHERVGGIMPSEIQGGGLR